MVRLVKDMTAMANELLRTFVALPLSEALHDQLAEVQKPLKRRCPGESVRWVDPHSIHLTLFFLGEILPNCIPSVKEALHVVARTMVPFTFHVEGLGAFPNVKRPRVIWVGLQEPTGKLALLHQAVNEALSHVGFKPENRPFNPHLTLGRVRRQTAAEELRKIEKVIVETSVDRVGTEDATEIILFRSILKPGGAEYTPLERFPLG